MEKEVISTIATWVIYFMFYSIVGYLFEIIYCSIQAKEFRNRGFLYGPWCPIYGVGMVMVLLVVEWLNWPWWANVVIIIVLCDILEYITSVLMERIFHMRWWDYTNNTLLNLNGRISLDTSIGFGVAGMLAIYLVHPFLSWAVSLMPIAVMILVAGVLAGFYLMDTILSLVAAFNVKGMLDGGRVDLTGEIKKFAAHYYDDLAKRAKKKRKQKTKRRKR